MATMNDELKCIEDKISGCINQGLCCEVIGIDQDLNERYLSILTEFREEIIRHQEMEGNDNRSNEAIDD